VPHRLLRLPQEQKAKVERANRVIGDTLLDWDLQLVLCNQQRCLYSG
jgi:hypothetical protein